MRGKVRAIQENFDGSEAMKSFKVTDFNAPLTEVDQPTPQPSGTQVLIKVKAAGVCHSDLHIWEGGYDLGHGRKPLSLKDRGVSLPRTMGHETVGEVVAFGPCRYRALVSLGRWLPILLDSSRPTQASTIVFSSAGSVLASRGIGVCR